MASFAVSSATSTNATQSVSTAKQTPAPTEATTSAPAALQPDTVKLSQAGQAKLMYRQGQSISAIANSLGADVASVDGYLNIKVAAQASATPTPAPAAESDHETHATPAAQSAPVAQPAPTEPANPAVLAVPSAPIEAETTGKAG